MISYWRNLFKSFFVSQGEKKGKEGESKEGGEGEGGEGEKKEGEKKEGAEDKKDGSSGVSKITITQ